MEPHKWHKLCDGCSEREKETQQHLSTLKERSQLEHQTESVLNTRWREKVSEEVQIVRYMTQSSAKRRIEEEIQSEILLMKTRKRRGARAEPRGAPDVTGQQLEKVLPTKQYLRRLVRRAWIQGKTFIERLWADSLVIAMGDSVERVGEAKEYQILLSSAIHDRYEVVNDGRQLRLVREVFANPLLLWRKDTVSFKK